MDPSTLHRHATQSGDYRDDPAQQAAISALQHVHDRLVQQTATANKPLQRLLASLLDRPAVCNQGLYLWGGVGRGKTWLMKLFYQSLPFKQKKRLHFHHFMLDVQKRLLQQQNQKNPLQRVARDIAAQYRVLCLDEFIVTNITDAMILYALLDALFACGTTLVMTSNRNPDDLYLNGLQRERFLPAIALIKQHTRIVHLNGDTDHRLALLEQSDVYYTPLTAQTRQALGQRLQALASDSIEYDKVLHIHRRPVSTVACADEIAWFDFDALCDAPRAAQDYIVLAQEFHTLLLSGVPVMDQYLDDKARRFIYLIDELYDRCVKLIISAETTPDKLYTGEMLKFAFNRTSSRLIEMRSEDYLSRPHASRR